MIKFESGCVGCSGAGGYGCDGESCPNYYTPIPICDDCGNEVEELFQDGEDQVCEECLKTRHPVIDLDKVSPYDE